MDGRLAELEWWCKARTRAMGRVLLEGDAQIPGGHAIRGTAVRREAVRGEDRREDGARHAHDRTHGDAGHATGKNKRRRDDAAHGSGHADTRAGRCRRRTSDEDARAARGEEGSGSEEGTGGAMRRGDGAAAEAREETEDHHTPTTATAATAPTRSQASPHRSREIDASNVQPGKRKRTQPPWHDYGEVKRRKARGGWTPTYFTQARARPKRDDIQVGAATLARVTDGGYDHRDGGHARRKRLFAGGDRRADKIGRYQ
jgi:hypothetical protein